ncbi:hypothetical protein PVAND_002559 [Polypedilum vanderplanki]|uniref:Uncharacterized protein n=1 Tax=Polypedilum vanderplanki TaxID=319348 RepID=A0A9J6BRJ6_POLVA|nr:hypothetical protein PVAND_002559 [Polypedilum vanderplanki]
MKLKKKEKLLWKFILDRTGNLDESVLHLLQFNGFINVSSISGLFDTNVTNETILTTLQNSVREMPADSPDLKKINCHGRPYTDYSLNFGERCSILGFLQNFWFSLMSVHYLITWIALNNKILSTRTI